MYLWRNAKFAIEKHPAFSGICRGSRAINTNVMKKLTILSSCLLTAAIAVALPYAVNEKHRAGISNAPIVMRHADGRIPVSQAGMPSRLKTPVRTGAAQSVKLMGNVIYSTYTGSDYIHPPGIYTFDAAGNFEREFWITKAKSTNPQRDISHGAIRPGRLIFQPLLFIARVRAARWIVAPRNRN